MKKLVLIILLGVPLLASAMTEEQRQRFLYYFYQAEHLWQTEQYADAYALFDFCHDLNPDDPMVNLHLGHIYKGCKLTDQALVYYRKAWLKAMEECWDDYAVTLYNAGGEANRLAAVKVMEQTTKTVKQDIELWDRLRDGYIGVGKYKQALSAQDEFDKVEGSGYTPYSAMNRYRIYSLMQQPKKAIYALEKYLENDPANLQFQMYLVQLYELTNQPQKKIIALYDRVLSLDPYNALVLNNYAYLLACRKGDLLQAEQMSLKAIQADPQNPTYLDTYAWIMYLTGQIDLAKLYIRQAVLYVGDKEIPDEIQQHYNAIFK